MQSPPNIRRYVPLLVWTVAIGIMFWPILFGGEAFGYRDAARYFIPIKLWTLEWLREGVIPLWNPHHYMGLPFASNPANSLFYPGNLLALGTSTAQGISIWLVGHVWATGVLTWALLLRWTSHEWAALIGAIAFAMGGPLLSSTGNPMYLISTPWFVWALLLYDRESPWAGVSIGILVTTGDLQLAMAACALIIVWPRSNWKRVVWTWLSAAGIATVVIIPTLEFLPFTERAHALAAERQLIWSLHPARLLSYLWPFPWGLPDEGWHGHAWVMDGDPRFWFNTLYIGIVPIVCAVWGTTRIIHSRQARIGLALFIAALLLSMAGFIPGLDWLTGKLPGLNRLRYPEKWMMAATFGLAILASLGARSALERRKRSGLITTVLVGLTCGDIILQQRPAVYTEPSDRFDTPSILRETLTNISPEQRVMRFKMLDPKGAMDSREQRRAAQQNDIDNLRPNYGMHRGGLMRVDGFTGAKWSWARSLQNRFADDPVGLSRQFAVRWLLIPPKLSTPAIDEAVRQGQLKPVLFNEKVVMLEIVNATTRAQCGNGNCLIKMPTPNTIEIQTQGATEIILADPFYPDWIPSHGRIEAFEERSRLTVPAGTEKVTLRFDPTSVQLGGAVSLLTLLLVLLAAAWRKRYY